MEDKFSWTDELVREFALECKVNGASDWVHTQIEQFKASKLPSKEYEILSFYDGCKNGQKDDRCIRSIGSFSDDFIIRNNISIHSVKRLVDGAVFELNKTRVVDPNTKHEWVISEITNNKGTIYFNGVWINHVQKVKQPLFITEDGVSVTDEEQIVWYVDDRCKLNTRKAKNANGSPKCVKIYSKANAAEEYILLNKPCLSLNDLLSVWDEQASIDLYRKSPLFKNFKELAKSKINQK